MRGFLQGRIGRGFGARDDLSAEIELVTSMPAPDARPVPNVAIDGASKKKLVNVEAGRGVAALLVVLYHADRFYFLSDKYWHASALGGLFRFGHAGVQFFFVLSGYIMMTVHRRDIGNRSKVWPFVQKRFHRIYPFFWLVMAVTMALYFLFPEMGRPEYRQVPVIVQSVLLAGRDPFLAPVFVSWTLWHEILFYSIFAIIIALPRVGSAVFIGWVALCLWQTTSTGVPPWPPYLTNFLNVLFGLGIAAAAALQRWRIPWPGAILVIGLGLFFGTGVASDLMPSMPSVLEYSLYGLGSALALLGGVEIERSQGLQAPRWLVALGAASFSIYLTHMLTLPFAAKAAVKLGLTHRLPALLGFLLLTCTAVAVGVAIHHLVEVRIVSLSRRIASALTFRRKPARTGTV